MSLGDIRRLDGNRIRIKDKPGLITVIAAIAGVPCLLGGFELVALVIRGFTDPASVEPDTLKWPVRLAVMLSAAGFLAFGVLLTFSRDYILLDAGARAAISTKVRMFQKTVTRRPFAEFTAIQVAWRDISQDDGPSNWYVVQVSFDGAKPMALVRLDEWDPGVAAAADISRLTGLPIKLDPWRPSDASRPAVSHSRG